MLASNADIKCYILAFTVTKSSLDVTRINFIFGMIMGTKHYSTFNQLTNGGIGVG